MEDTTGSGAAENKDGGDTDLFRSDEEESEKAKRLSEKLAQHEFKETKACICRQVFHFARCEILGGRHRYGKIRGVFPKQ